MKWKNYLRPALCGAAAGFVNGFFGAGGGMVLVPLLIRLGKMEDKKAFSSSVCIILPLCLVSLGIYAAKGCCRFGMRCPISSAARAAAFWPDFCSARCPPAHCI